MEQEIKKRLNYKSAIHKIFITTLIFSALAFCESHFSSAVLVVIDRGKDAKENIKIAHRIIERIDGGELKSRIKKRFPEVKDHHLKSLHLKPLVYESKHQDDKMLEVVNISIKLTFDPELFPGHNILNYCKAEIEKEVTRTK